MSENEGRAGLFLALQKSWEVVDRNRSGTSADSTSAIEVEPNNPWSYVDRGVWYASKGDLARAIADYTEAIRL